MSNPKQSDVWLYDYLWHREHEAGAENGRKPRPTALVTRFTDKYGSTNLFLLPITSKEPHKDKVFIEMSQIERRRAGLSSNMRLWVILDEYNHDYLETSYYLDPKGRKGAFSTVFTQKVLKSFINVARQSRTKLVRRN